MTTTAIGILISACGISMMTAGFVKDKKYDWAVFTFMLFFVVLVVSLKL